MKKNYKISIIGLGYVGLPLALAFAKKFKTIGFDINNNRINQLKKGTDVTRESSENELNELIFNDKPTFENQVNGLFVTTSLKDIADSNVYIITVPTPTDERNRPDLTPLIKASEMIASVIKSGDIVVYESTVYPGVTMDECVPVIEKYSNLKLNKDFYVGYSPERINPGDKINKLETIVKITSGSSVESAKEIDKLYNSIITAGTYLAASINVAEAAKVIENTQRDINIAFMNELSNIFSLLNLDTNEVLDAAASKWNFLRFSPGLVGGHCIGVDPFYLAQKAKSVGYNPEIILSARKINDSMGLNVASRTIKLMIKKDIKIKGANVLILGFTFKENCPDYRNTKVIDVYNELLHFDTKPIVYDPWLDVHEIKNEYEINFTNVLPEGDFSAIVIAVAHDCFKKIDLYSNKDKVIFDVKGLLDKSLVDGRL